MLMFQTPAPTRFDLNFSIAGFHIRVHPLFWLIAFLFGSSGSLVTIPIWIFVVFASIVIHELGHAFAFRFYGINSHIVLHTMGGLCIPESAPWGTGYADVAPTPRQQIVISLAGPAAGFVFAAVVIAGILGFGGTVESVNFLGIIPLPVRPSLPFGGQLLTIFAALLLYVNIYWGIINLLPVFPLDGGQVARNALLINDPNDGVRKSLWLSVITGGILAVVGVLLMGSIYMGLLFGMLAYQSYQALQGQFGRY